MQHDSSNSNSDQQPSRPDPRTAADDIDENDPHKVEKLANIGKDTDVAEAAENE